jgi:hypothetical protein
VAALSADTLSNEVPTTTNCEAGIVFSYWMSDSGQWEFRSPWVNRGERLPASTGP